MNKNRITMAHGGGGELTQQLIARHVLPRIGAGGLKADFDAADLGEIKGRICMTTDSFVVTPLFFPGGDIGRLAVCGTVNDLAVMGAEPIALSLALVIEEGLEFEALDRILDSMATAAAEAGVRFVTGDTKVIERSRGDGLIVNTAGIGAIPKGRQILPSRVAPGHAVIVSGPIAEHGLAVMSAREGLSFGTSIKSDAAPLNGLIKAMLATGARIDFMRDPTRGGLAGVLADLRDLTGLTIEVDENAVPITAAVRHTAECVGLDPLTIANEGKCVIVAPAADAAGILSACHAHPLGAGAAVIGHFTSAAPPLVELITRIGGRRVVDRPVGEDLPRIC